MKTKTLNTPNYETVVQCDLTNDVQAIIAVHNTKLGPALGGCRFYNYASADDALTDVLRLSEGMSYKSAMAGLPLGGGKSVIIGDPQKQKSKELLEAFGEFVESLEGKYITAKDVGVGVEDLDVIASKTSYCRGTSAKGSSGDPSPVTAYGVYQGMRAAAKHHWGSPSLKGKTVIVQGLGHVGLETAKHVIEDGATVYGCDINPQSTKIASENYGIKIIDINDWSKTEGDIFCPCAMGAILNETSINALKNNGIQIVAGGANNQLLNVNDDGHRLKDADITYAPDYIINAGGVINIAMEITGGSPSDAIEHTAKIYEITLKILERAQKENKPTAQVSLEMAREKLGL